MINSLNIFLILIMQNIKIIVIVLTLICVLAWLSFIPVWPKSVKNGVIKVDTYKKIQLVLGIIRID
jgi:hypothetical protein